MWKYIKLILQVGPRILWDFLFYINKYARHPERYPIEVRYKKVHDLVVFVLNHFKIDWDIKGLENLEALKNSDKPYLVASNHQSDLDPLLLMYFSERPISFISKIEAKKFPFIGTAVNALSGIYVDRNDLKQELRAMIELRKNLSEGNLAYGIYPEGTRNKEPITTDLLEYKAGAFKAAKSAGVPILPVTIYGTFRPFKPRPDYKRSPIEVTFGTPIEPEQTSNMDTEQISEMIYEWTLSELHEMKQKDKEFFDKGYQKIPLKRGKLR